MKPRPSDDYLHFGYFFPGGKTNHIFSDEAARRVPEMTKANLIELAQIGEQIGFDSLFLADSWSGHRRASERYGHQSPTYHAPLLGMALLSATERIGVITTLHTTYHHPVHIARMGATLDAFSDGRWGWNVVTGMSAGEAELFGGQFVAHDERYQMADELVLAVKELWAEPDVVDFHGKYFEFRGRLKAPRPVQQPYPLLVSAGGSPAGTAFAAKNVDQLVILANTLERVQEADARLQPQLAKSGRTVTTTPFAVAVVRPNEGEAEEEWERLVAGVNAESVREIAADTLGNIESSKAMFAEMGEQEALRKFGAAGAQLKLIGTPEQVADQLTAVHGTTNSRNVLVAFPLWSPAELATFSPVLKILRERGVWTPPEERNYSW